KGPEGAKIRRVAEAVAAANPLGRRVVLRGDASCPTEEAPAASRKKAASPGAAILAPDGSVSQVLRVARGPRATAGDRAFVAAATPSRGPRRAVRRRVRRPKR